MKVPGRSFEILARVFVRGIGAVVESGAAGHQGFEQQFGREEAVVLIHAEDREVVEHADDLPGHLLGLRIPAGVLILVTEANREILDDVVERPNEILEIEEPGGAVEQDAFAVGFGCVDGILAHRDSEVRRVQPTVLIDDEDTALHIYRRAEGEIEPCLLAAEGKVSH